MTKKNLGMNPDRVNASLSNIRSTVAQIDSASSSANYAASMSRFPESYGVPVGQDVIAPWSVYRVDSAVQHLKNARNAAESLLNDLSNEILEQRDTSARTPGEFKKNVVTVDKEGRVKVSAAAEAKSGPGTKGSSAGAWDGVYASSEGEMHAGAKAEAKAEATVGLDGVNAKVEGDAYVGGLLKGEAELDAGVGKLGAEGEVFGGLRAKGDAEAHVGPGGASVKAGVEAMAGAKADGKITAEMGPVKAEYTGEGFAGAKADAKAGAQIGPYGASANAGVSAFAGASAEVGTKVSVAGAEAGAKIGVAAGAGVDAKVEAAIGWEKVAIAAGGKIALGPGVTLEIDFSFSPKELSEGIGRLFGF